MKNPKLKRIIECLLVLYCEKLKRDRVQMTSHDFYYIIRGVYKTRPCRVSSSEFEEHQKGLKEAGIDFEISDAGKFLIYNSNHSLGLDIRFYINAHDAKSGREIVKAAAEGLKEEKFKIKTAGLTKYGYNCLDNTVLYIEKNANIKSVMEFFKELTKTNPELFEKEVPFTTGKFAKGVGIGFSPLYEKRTILGNKFPYMSFSFNQLHSTVLGISFDEIVKRKIFDLDEMTSLYTQALKEAGFNPEKPYLIQGVDDPLEGMI